MSIWKIRFKTNQKFLFRKLGVNVGINSFLCYPEHFNTTGESYSKTMVEFNAKFLIYQKFKFMLKLEQFKVQNWKLKVENLKINNE